MGWKTTNVDNMSRLRLLREDKVDVKEIVRNQGKVIEFKQIEKIRIQANEKIADSISFKPIEVPIMKFGTTEEKIFFKNLLEYNKAV